MTPVCAASQAGVLPLAGRTVVLTRSADRAGAMLEALQSAGAGTLLLPVIDFQEPDRPEEVEDALTDLADGDFAWVVFTSITTIRSLTNRARRRGTTLAALVPASTRVAAVGTSTRSALEAEGIGVDLVPSRDQSASGILDDWPALTDGRTAVLLPQADIASDTLVDGLAARGWVPAVVVAYRTVDYPADPELRLARPGHAGDARAGAAEAGAAGAGAVAATTLSLEDFAAESAAGRVDALVLTSPSAVRRLADVAAVVAGSRDRSPALVAIGHSTERQALDVGLRIAAVAETPDAPGITAAVESALSTGRVRTNPTPPGQAPPTTPGHATPGHTTPGHTTPGQARTNPTTPKEHP